MEFKLLTSREIVKPLKIPVQVRWNKLSKDSIKLNFDGSFNKNQSLCGYGRGGGVFRGYKGQWIAGYHGKTSGLLCMQN